MSGREKEAKMHLDNALKVHQEHIDELRGELQQQIQKIDTKHQDELEALKKEHSAALNKGKQARERARKEATANLQLAEFNNKELTRQLAQSLNKITSLQNTLSGSPSYPEPTRKDIEGEVQRRVEAGLEELKNKLLQQDEDNKRAAEKKIYDKTRNEVSHFWAELYDKKLDALKATFEPQEEKYRKEIAECEKQVEVKRQENNILLLKSRQQQDQIESLRKSAKLIQRNFDNQQKSFFAQHEQLSIAERTLQEQQASMRAEAEAAFEARRLDWENDRQRLIGQNHELQVQVDQLREQNVTYDESFEELMSDYEQRASKAEKQLDAEKRQRSDDRERWQVQLNEANSIVQENLEQRESSERLARELEAILSTTTTQLQEEQQKRESERNWLQGQLNEARGNLQVALENQEVSKRSSEATEQELSATRLQLSNECDQLRDQLIEANQKLHEALERQESVKHTSEGEQKQYFEETEQLRSQLEKAKGQLQETVEKEESSKRLIEGLKLELSAAESRLEKERQQHDDEVGRLRSQLTESKANLQLSLEKVRTELSTTVLRLEEERERSNSLIAAMETMKEHKSSQGDQTHASEKEDYERKIQKLEADLAESILRTEEATESKDELTAQYDQVYKAFQMLVDEREEKESELDAANRLIEQKTADLNNFYRDLEKLRELNQKLKEENNNNISQAMANSKSLQGTIEAYEGDIELLKTQVADHQNIVKALRFDLEQQKNYAKSMKEQVEKSIRERDDLEKNKYMTTSQCEDMRARLRQMERTLEDQRKKTSTAEKLARDSEAALDARSQELQQLAGRLSEAIEERKELDRLRHLIPEMTATIDKYERYENSFVTPENSNVEIDEPHARGEAPRQRNLYQQLSDADPNLDSSHGRCSPLEDSPDNTVTLNSGEVQQARETGLYDSSKHLVAVRAESALGEAASEANKKLSRETGNPKSSVLGLKSNVRGAVKQGSIVFDPKHGVSITEYAYEYNPLKWWSKIYFDILPITLFCLGLLQSKASSIFYKIRHRNLKVAPAPVRATILLMAFHLLIYSLIYFVASTYSEVRVERGLWRDANRNAQIWLQVLQNQTGEGTLTWTSRAWYNINRAMNADHRTWG